MVAAFQWNQTATNGRGFPVESNRDQWSWLSGGIKPRLMVAAFRWNQTATNGRGFPLAIEINAILDIERARHYSFGGAVALFGALIYPRRNRRQAALRET
jgi:hypothetical protein